MNSALSETRFIYDRLLSEKQQNHILNFLHEVNGKKGDYETSAIWLLDQEIGGIGGYCMPSDPRNNPFSEGTERELFRPLQYVRSEIDLCDLRVQTRQVVQYSGMHLEAVFKLFLQNKGVIGDVRHKNLSFVQDVYEISKMNLFEENMIEVLYKYIVLYNRAKHEINVFGDIQRRFAPSDAIISYFGARIIGQAFLAELNYPGSGEVFEIHQESNAS